MNSVEIAVDKANQEVKKNLQNIKELCNKCNFGELSYCLYYVHTSRILKLQEVESLKMMSIDRFDDVLKYTISCIFKYSNISIVPKSDYKINLDRSISLTKISNHLHTLHEMIALFSILDEVEFVGERRQKAKIDFSKVTKDLFKKKSFEYSARFQKSISYDKSEPLPPAVLFEKFAKKYAKYDLISKELFGLKVKEITIKLNKLLDICLENMKNTEKDMEILGNGNIDIFSEKTLKVVVENYIFDEKEIFNIFGKAGMKFIREFTFIKSEFKSHELSYHYISRKPFLKIKNKFIIVPELILDSLLTNIHYTLLENNTHSEKHKKIMSDLFVNEILDIGKKYEFYKFDSELELYKGKNKLGDIDLILRHENYDFDILIEAKNHVVPLSVYYGDHEQISKRLEDLQKNWEKKVDNRYKHLLQNHTKYNIKGNFKYLIVSRYPEILSHHSNYLVLSIREFEFFIQNNCQYESFDNLRDDLYNTEDWNFEDLELFMKETLSCTVL